MKNRKIPWFWRRQLSCPDCGFIYDEAYWAKAVTIRDKKGYPLATTCPRCKAHYTEEDFWALQSDKYSLKADL